MLLLLSISMKAQTILTNKGAKINLSGGVKMSVYADFRNDGHVELDDTLMLKGSFIHSDTLSFRNSSGTIYLNGIGSQLLECSGEKEKVALPSVVINKPTGTIQLKGNISLLSAWTYIQGFIDVFTYNSWVYLTNQNNIISGKAVFDNLEWVGNDSIAFVITDTITIKDTLMISGNSPVILDSAVVYAEGNLINSNTAYNGGGSANIVLMGDGEQQVVGLDSATVNAEGRGRLPNITVNKTSGSVNWKGVVNIGGKLHWQQGYGIANNYSKVVLFETDSILGGNAISEATLPAFYELKYITNHNRKLGSPTAIHKKLTLNGGSLKLNGNKLFVNTADKDVFESNSKIISTKEADQVQWLVNSDTGSYTIPFANIQGNATPVTITIHEPGLTYQEGGIVVNTFTTNNNDSIPASLNSDAQRLLIETPKLVADRYWNVTATGYSVKPKATFQFKYINADIATPNTLHEDSLQLSYWKENCWEAIAGSVDTANNTFNSDTTDIYTTYVLHSRNADLLCNDGSEFNRAIMLTEADYTESEFTLLPDSVFWLRFIADDSSMLFRVYEADTTPLNLNSIQLYSCTDTCLKTDYVADTTDKQYIKLTGLNPGNIYRLRFAKEDAQAASKFKLDHPSLQLFAEALTDEADSNGYFSLKLWYFDRYNVYPLTDTSHAFRWRIYSPDPENPSQSYLIENAITTVDSNKVILQLTEGSYYYEIEERKNLNETTAGQLLYTWKMPAYNVNTFKVRSFGNVAYEDLYNESTFASASQINLDRPVGTIQGIHGTTPTGGATYTIPIPLPPGTNGMVPNIALTYNSQAGNGIAGMGWNLSGLSMITRTGRDYYHDNQVAPVLLNSSDYYALNGSRLVMTSLGTTYGSDGVAYDTENASFSKITSKGKFIGHLGNMPDLVNTPLWFLMETKDGIKMEFGNNQDSRFVSYRNTHILIWSVNKIYDNYGNYITIKYENDLIDKEHPRISEISYTGSNQFSPYNHIKFEYKKRIDIYDAYVGETKISSKYLLDKIIITTENDVVYKSYELKYSKDNLYSYLTEITEKAESSSALNSTKFMYNLETDAGYEIPTNLNINVDIEDYGTKADCFSGDFNGDGIMEIVIIKRKISSNIDSVANIYTKTGSGYSLLASFEFNESNGETLNSIADFDGDGRSDLLVIERGGFGAVNRTKIYKLVGSPLVFQEYYSQPSSSPYIWANTFTQEPENINFLYISDFDGDGKKDYMTILGNANDLVDFNDGKISFNQIRFEPIIHFPSKQIQRHISFPNAGLLFPSMDWYSDKISILDFNGDGKDEIMIRKSFGCSIYELWTLGGISYFATPINSPTFPNNNHKIFLGDFNGDKKTDLFFKDGSVWKSAFSTGNLFVINNSVNINSNNNDKFLVADFNADGKSDVLYGKYVQQSNETELNFYLSYGIGFYHHVPTCSGSICDNLGNIKLKSGDFDGNGTVDLLDIKNNGQIYIRNITVPNKNRLLYKVSDGLGKLTTYQYDLMTNPAFHTTNKSFNNNVIKGFQAGVPAVSSITVPDGIGGHNTTTFQYENAILHRGGKGFLGFEKIISENSSLNTKTITEYELNLQYFIPMLKRQTKYLSNNNIVIGQSIYSDNIINISNNNVKRHYTQIGSRVELDMLSNKQVFITVGTGNYDAWGNIKRIKVDAGNILGSPTESIVVETTYGAYGTPCPSKPELITKTTHRSGQSQSYVNKTKYEYYPTGKIFKETLNYQQPCSLLNTYTYNTQLGHIVHIFQGEGAEQRTTTTYFDSKGRYPEEVINPAGQTSHYAYDPKWGKPISIEGIDDKITTVIYDEWGRTNSITIPGDPDYTLNFSYEWDIQAGPQYSIYKTSISDPYLPNVTTWYDIYNREIKSETEGFNSEPLTSKTYYYADGNLKEYISPHYSSDTYLFNLFQYDAYKRLTTTYSNYGYVDYSYSTRANGGIIVNATNNVGQSNKTTVDATGKTIQVEDNSGTKLDYEYYSSGLLKRIKMGSKQLVYNEYDECNRQKLLNDVDAGDIHYVYNVFGELKIQTDAKGNIHEMEYDVLGRITERAGPEGTTIYQYWPEGQNGVNQIKKITGFNSGWEQEYAYDDLGRLTTETEKNSGLTFIKQYGYNDNRLTTYTYPSGFAIKYQYDNNGYLTDITNPSGTKAYFTANEYNSFGQCTEYESGNGVLSKREYQSGMPRWYRTHSHNIHDSYIEYESLMTGNVSLRNDNNNDVTEQFAYDGLDRLTSTQVTGQSAININYNTNGNILSKTDVGGQYSYHNQKIHAVREINLPSANIPLMRQDIDYTSFGQTQKITEKDVNEILYEITFDYGADYQRRKSTLKYDNDIINTRFYFGDYEINAQSITEVDAIHYINSPAGLVAMYVDDAYSSNDNMYYTYTDHLGSIVTVTDEAGDIVAEQSFDAWGRTRNPANWTYDLTGAPANPRWLYRGYTGHEHLPEFGLINMNGRMYDPVVGRMLSPDNYVQNPYSTQNYNRYSYVANNPMKYTDPSGQIIQITGEGKEWMNDAFNTDISIFGIKEMRDFDAPRFWEWLKSLFCRGGDCPSAAGTAGAGSSGGGRESVFSDKDMTQIIALAGSTGAGELKADMMLGFQPPGMGMGMIGADPVLLAQGPDGDGMTKLEYNINQFFWKTEELIKQIFSYEDENVNYYSIENNPIINSVSGIKNLSSGLVKLFSNGSIRNKSIIDVRKTLLDNGFKQGVSENKKGYLFKNNIGEEVRIMYRNGKWDIRVKNKFNNYLDEFGSPNNPDKTHNINLNSK